MFFAFVHLTARSHSVATGRTNPCSLRTPAMPRFAVRLDPPPVTFSITCAATLEPSPESVYHSAEPGSFILVDHSSSHSAVTPTRPHAPWPPRDGRLAAERRLVVRFGWSASSLEGFGGRRFGAFGSRGRLSCAAAASAGQRSLDSTLKSLCSTSAAADLGPPIERAKWNAAVASAWDVS